MNRFFMLVVFASVAFVSGGCAVQDGRLVGTVPDTFRSVTSSFAGSEPEPLVEEHLVPPLVRELVAAENGALPFWRYGYVSKVARDVAKEKVRLEERYAQNRAPFSEYELKSAELADRIKAEEAVMWQRLMASAERRARTIDGQIELAPVGSAHRNTLVSQGRAAVEAYEYMGKLAYVEGQMDSTKADLGWNIFQHVTTYGAGYTPDTISGLTHIQAGASLAKSGG